MQGSGQQRLGGCWEHPLSSEECVSSDTPHADKDDSALPSEAAAAA